MIVQPWADQLLPQLLMDQFETLRSQYRHIGHLHLRNFDTEKIMFDKIPHANVNLEFFSWVMCVL